jgi:hypothetical protein
MTVKKMGRPKKKHGELYRQRQVNLNVWISPMAAKLINEAIAGTNKTKASEVESAIMSYYAGGPA